MNIDFMRKHVKILAVVVVALIIGASVWYYLESIKSDKAEDFTVTDLDGNTFTLFDYKDEKVVLLDFMSVTCPTCEEEMPELRKIHQKWGERIEMLSICVGSDDEDDLRDLMEEHHATWRAARDTDGVFEKYGVTSIVRVIIVDKEDKITYSHVGTSSAKKLNKE
ncbi:MAG: TlpA family protein disulfide reductase, partial [Thermoplasmata archaeon]|nr:TlpA family protein disulfide reductase [Thermoplasmata archaeon]